MTTKFKDPSSEMVRQALVLRANLARRGATVCKKAGLLERGPLMLKADLHSKTLYNAGTWTTYSESAYKKPSAAIALSRSVALGETWRQDEYQCDTDFHSHYVLLEVTDLLNHGRLSL